MHSSLVRYCPDFTLWVLCMDELCEEVLNRLVLPAVNIVPIRELEWSDERLARTRGTRTTIEYYFTCTPCLPLYLLTRYPHIAQITYLDADLYFFGDPDSIFAEIGKGSIAIVPHRWSRNLEHMREFGIYNVCWLSFRRDDYGIACLRWYREQCLHWCHDWPEVHRCGDQKYLDDWPQRFEHVAVIKQRGANLASWNLDSHLITRRPNGSFFVDGDPLIFFHFHGLTFPSAIPDRYGLNIRSQHLALGTPLREVCQQYLDRVTSFSAEVSVMYPGKGDWEPLRGAQLPVHLP